MTERSLTRTKSGRLILGTKIVGDVRTLTDMVDASLADRGWVTRSETVLREIPELPRPVALTETQVLRIVRLLQEADLFAVPEASRQRWETVRVASLARVTSWGNASGVAELD